MHDEKTQPSAGSMAFQRSCYYSNCDTSPNWGIKSSAEVGTPNNSPLTLLSCDDHYGELTVELRDAGTRYTLFPITDAPATRSLGSAPLASAPEDDHPQKISKGSRIGRLVVNMIAILVGLIIAPFLIVYLGGKWFLGWRPSPTHENI